MSHFEVGGLYFWLEYADHERLFLVPGSLVFLGKNLEQGVIEDTWYFQDSRSYCFHGPWSFGEPLDEATKEKFDRLAEKSLPTRLVMLRQSSLHEIVDCEGLATAASECARRRTKAGKQD